MLQCRSGKRTGKGAVKIAVDMVREGLIDIRSAMKMVEPQHLDQLLHPQVDSSKLIFKCGFSSQYEQSSVAYTRKSLSIRTRRRHRSCTEIDIFFFI